MVVDVGGGTSEVAVISLGRIVVSRSVRVGGYDLDEAIAAPHPQRARHGDRLAERRGDQARRRLGRRLTTELEVDIRGRDLLSGLPRKLQLTSQEVRGAIASPLTDIMAAIHATLEETPPELAGDIVRHGILLAGGGSLLRGFAERVEAETAHAGVPRGLAAHLRRLRGRALAGGARHARAPGRRRAAPLTMAVTARVRTRGLVLTEHEFKVPLDHADARREQITVFAREVADPDGLDRPFLVFLQGGPGFEAPRPTRHPSGPGWLDRALADFRVLMLDQRGTGRSTPVGDAPGMTPAEQAEYLTHFRADAIVRDAEHDPPRARRRAAGACSARASAGCASTTYLSFAPEGLREAFITGGLPALGRPVDDVYRARGRAQLERNRRYYERYPRDRDRVRDLVARLDGEPRAAAVAATG